MLGPWPFDPRPIPGTSACRLLLFARLGLGVEGVFFWSGQLHATRCYFWSARLAKKIYAVHRLAALHEHERLEACGIGNNCNSVVHPLGSGTVPALLAVQAAATVQRLTDCGLRRKPERKGWYAQLSRMGLLVPLDGCYCGTVERRQS